MIGNINIPYFTVEKQKEIIIQIENLFAFTHEIEDGFIRAKSSLNKLPQAILSKAFRGELVPQGPMMNQRVYFWRR